MNSPSTFIGRIKNLAGNRLSIQLDEKIKSIMPIIDGVLYKTGQIGSFVKIPLGYTSLYGIVTQIGADAIPDSLKEVALESNLDKYYTTRWINVSLVGEKIGNKFERGVTLFPNVEDEVHIVTISDLDLIYGGLGEDHSITVGNISVSESLPAKLDINKLITRHCALVGATGSGKSNSVAVILNEIGNERKFKSARVLVIDPHGEYNIALKEKSHLFRIDANKAKNENELYIPYWALPFDVLLSLFSGHLNDQQKDYVRDKILALKLEAATLLDNKPNLAAITADSPIPFNINRMWFELDDIERQTFSNSARTELTSLLQTGNADDLKSNIYQPASLGSAAPFLSNKVKGILNFLDSVKNKLLDKRYKFLFDISDYNCNSQGKVNKDLDALLKSWLAGDKPITVLDLSGVPSEIITSISGTLLKIVYDALFWAQELDVGGRNQPLLIVLEEAHNYLKAGENSISSKTVQAISKEGRKYGVGLLLVTQRPSELDTTVLSQCGTIISLRMFNASDRSHITSAIQDDLNEITSLLPSLRTGEGLVVGEAVKIPSRVKFYKMPESPKSGDPKISLKWNQDKPNSALYKDALLLWRDQKFEKK